VYTYIHIYIHILYMHAYTYIYKNRPKYIYIYQSKETYYRPKRDLLQAQVYIYIYIYIYIAHACIHINIQEPANIDQHHASYTDIIRQGRIHDIQDVYLYIYKNRPTSTDVMFAPQISFDKDAGTKQRKSAHTTCTV